MPLPVIPPFGDENDPVFGPEPEIPIVPDYDLPVDPPISNTILPSPQILAAVTPEPKPNQLTMTAAQPGDIEPYVFGRCVADAKIIAADDSGDRVYLDLLWSVGEIEGVEYMIVAGKNEGLGTALGNNEHFNGTSTQAASPIMTGLKGTYDVLLNKAHSVMGFRESFANLNVKAMVKGLKLHDPRISPAVPTYSTNPALCLARILTDCGYTVDDTSLASAANYCDELIGSPQEKRWEVGIQITQRKELKHWIKTFAAYCNCFIEIQGTTVYLIPDTPRAANHTVLADNMIAGSVRVTRAGVRNVPDRVAVSYKPIIEAGSPTWKVAAENRTAETSTSAPSGKTTRLSMPGFQAYSMARRYATQTYNKAQNDLILEFDSFDEGINRTVGDVGTITNSAFNISAETMTLFENKQTQRGRWRRKYVDYDVSNYSDALFTEPDVNDTTLGDPNAPPDGPTPVLEEELFTDGAGVTYARFKVTFMGVLWAYLFDYYVVGTGTGPDGINQTVLDINVAQQGATTHTVYTDPLTSGVLYTVKVYIRSVTAALSATPGQASLTSSQGNNVLLDVGDVINMHVYTIDGDAKYATTSAKTGSPGVGTTWAAHYGSSPIALPIVDTTFQTEVWDAGATFEGAWQYVDVNVTLLGGTKSNFVRLSDDVSPQSFTDNVGASFHDTSRFMIAKVAVTDSPGAPANGLKVKLPIPASLVLGAA